MTLIGRMTADECFERGIFGTRMTRIGRINTDILFILSVKIRSIRVISFRIFICEDLFFEFGNVLNVDDTDWTDNRG